MATPQAVEYDAQGKPLPTSPQGVEYDAEGKPLSASNAPPPDPSGRTPTGEPAPGDNRNGFQRTLDNLTTPDPRREEWQGPVHNAADSFSRGVAENVLPFISHPLKSGLGVLKSLGGAIVNSGGTAEGFVGELAKPMIESAVQDYQDRGPALAIPHMVGQGTGAWATGELGGAAAKPVLSSIASKVAPIMERTGLKIGNSAVDSGLSSYAHGHNPARGLYDADVLPSLSPRSTMLKMENALPGIGERISGPIEASQAQIPLRSLADSIERPISSARGVANGPGIGGLPESTIDNIHASMFKKAPEASRPIYGPDAGIPYPSATPSDVWKTIRNLDEKTRYRMNQPPEIENANELQGNIRGGLRGNLEEAVPEIREPSRIYGDMQASRPGLNRVMNRGASLRSLFDVPMYPLETTVGNGLYKAGRNLPSLGQTAGEGARYLSPAAALIQELQKKKGVNQ